MPRDLITVVGLYLGLIAVTAMADDTPDHVDPDARHPGFTGPCQYRESFNLGGTIYLADPGAHQPRFLRDAVAGDPYATVSTRQPDADACEDELADGASTYLEAGAMLYAVDDWSPTFRLVSIQPSGRMVLYQAAWSTTARVAGDFLDLAGHGATVAYGPMSFCDERGCVDFDGSPPLPPRRAGEFLTAFLTSRIDPAALDHTYDDNPGQFYVEVQLPGEDERMLMYFECDTRTSTTGIVLSDAAIDDRELGFICDEVDP